MAQRKIVGLLDALCAQLEVPVLRLLARFLAVDTAVVALGALHSVLGPRAQPFPTLPAPAVDVYLAGRHFFRRHQTVIFGPLVPRFVPSHPEPRRLLGFEGMVVQNKCKDLQG